MNPNIYSFHEEGKVAGQDLFQKMIQPIQNAGIRLDSGNNLVNLRRTARALALAQNGYSTDFDYADPSVTDKVLIEKKEKTRLDATGMFLENTLTSFDPRVYETKYRDLSFWRNLFPVRVDTSQVNTNGMQTEQYAYQMVDFVGKAQELSSHATDYPESDVDGKWYFNPVTKIGDSYSFSYSELYAAVANGAQLQTMKIANAEKRMTNKHYDLLFNGSERISTMFGFTNHPNIPTGSVATVGGFTTWADKVANSLQEEVVRDVRAMVSSARTAMGGDPGSPWSSAMPGTIAIPLPQYLLISEYRSTTSDKTILDAIMNIEGVGMVVPIVDFAGAGAGGTDRMMGWISGNNEMTEYIITQPRFNLPMIQKGDVFQFAFNEKVAGFITRYPNAMISRDGL